MEKFYKDILTENTSAQYNLSTLVTEQSNKKNYKAYPDPNHASSLKIMGKDAKSLLMTEETNKPYMCAHAFKIYAMELEHALKSGRDYESRLEIVTKNNVYGYILNGLDVPDINFKKLADEMKEDHGDIHEFWFIARVLHTDDTGKEQAGFMIMGRHLLTGDPKQNCFYVADIFVKTNIFGKVKAVNIKNNKIYLYHEIGGDFERIVNVFAKALGY
jgi:hypothetical protein